MEYELGGGHVRDETERKKWYGGTLCGEKFE